MPETTAMDRLLEVADDAQAIGARHVAERAIALVFTALDTRARPLGTWTEDDDDGVLELACELACEPTPRMTQRH